MRNIIEALAFLVSGFIQEVRELRSVWRSGMGYKEKLSNNASIKPMALSKMIVGCVNDRKKVADDYVKSVISKSSNGEYVNSGLDILKEEPTLVSKYFDRNSRDRTKLSLMMNHMDPNRLIREDGDMNDIYDNFEMKSSIGIDLGMNHQFITTKFGS